MLTTQPLLPRIYPATHLPEHRATGPNSVNPLTM